MFELSDQAFARVQPLLPTNSRPGKPWRDHQQVLGGIVWKLAHRPALAGCAGAVRAVADLL
jgi:transposase